MPSSTETDLLTKLGRMLETQSIGSYNGRDDYDDDGDDDNDNDDYSRDGGIDEILHNLNTQVSMSEQTPPSPTSTPPPNSHTYPSSSSKENDNTNNTTVAARTKTSPLVNMPNRKTPYEVWLSNNKIDDHVRVHKNLTHSEQSGLVNRLHRTNKQKESQLQNITNVTLALEMSELTFNPVVNKKSLAETKDVKPLLLRQDGMLSKRQNELERQRESQRVAEMEECTFRPVMAGGAKSGRYLVRSGQLTTSSSGDASMNANANMNMNTTMTGLEGKRSTHDVLLWDREKERRRLARKDILEEEESKELSFSPNLNRRSLIISERVRRRKDEEERERTLNGTSVDNLSLSSQPQPLPGHEEESFTPSITLLAQSYKPLNQTPVHSRLYNLALKSNANKHNEQIKIRAQGLRGVYGVGKNGGKGVRGWEMEERDPKRSGSQWVKMVNERKQPSMNMTGSGSGNGNGNGKGEGRRGEEFCEEGTINVLEYDGKYDFILEKIRFDER